MMFQRTVTLVALLGPVAEVATFAPNSKAFQRRSCRSSTSLSLASLTDLNKKVGAGYAPPSGGNALFDPDQDGKLQGTKECQMRVAQGADFVLPSYKSPEPFAKGDLSGVELLDAQQWLEYLDEGDELPLNFAKPNAPVEATLLGSARVIGEDAPGDIQHIIMELPEGFHYVEGQSLSVIPPGNDAKTGRPHKPRLYSIASTRYGDALDGKTVSLCVRRALHYDADTGKEDPSKKGVCSNYLCDAPAGTKVSVAGPVGKTMLLPEDPNKDIIMVATGTGIAPFRGFMHRLFTERTVAGHMFGGTAWLVLGVPVTSGLLYKEEFDSMLQTANEGSLKIDYAISREMSNQKGGKYYVQDVIEEQADEVFHRLNNGAVMYFCGLKGMMPTILDTMERVASERGVDWKEMMQRLKANHQWHVEVY